MELAYIRPFEVGDLVSAFTGRHQQSSTSSTRSSCSY